MKFVDAKWRFLLKFILSNIFAFFIGFDSHIYATKTNPQSEKLGQQSQNKNKYREYSQRKKPRSLSYTYLMGITEKGINPRRFDIAARDYAVLARFESAYIKALPYLFPISNKEQSFLNFYSKKRQRTIPKCIHFIWIGPNTFPESSIKNIQSWKNHHPDWKIYFWTDSTDRPLPISNIHRRLTTEYDFGSLTKYILRTSNWGEKSDLMRYIILHNEGGIYVDHDTKCYQSFSRLCYWFDFIVGLERPHFHASINSCILPINALFASQSHHPILQRVIERVDEIWETIEKKYSYKTVMEENQKVIDRTFDSFAAAVVEKAIFQLDRKDLVLPTCYFYPTKIFDNRMCNKLKRNKIIYSKHTYEGSWKKEFVRSTAVP